MAFASGTPQAPRNQEWFPDHPREGKLRALQGDMLQPHTQFPMESSNTGDPRFNGVSGSIGWTSHIIVQTGKTSGGGTMAR